MASPRISLVSQTTRKNKAVFLVSSMHHQKCNDPSSKKPEIISYYNQTKGGVNALDEKCAKFSCSRRRRRWPMAIFFRLFDISTVNAYVLFNAYKDNPTQQRTDFLQDLAFQIVTSHLERRATNSYLSRKLKLTIGDISGVKGSDTAQEVRVERLQKRKTCHLCPPKNKRQTAYICYCCQKPICQECAKELCLTCAESL